MREFVLAHSYDPQSGEYTGPVNAWESPLEPGVFLLPANATFDEPPAAQPGKYRAWDGEAWIFVDIPPIETPVPKVADPAKQVRDERNYRLSICDWTQLADVPLAVGQKAAWVTYRQALRDVPQQEGFPENIVWPIAP